MTKLTRIDCIKEILENDLATLGGVMKQRVAGLVHEANGHDIKADPYGSATEVAAIELNADRLESDDEKIRLTVAALQRIENGTYGMCAGCGEEISEKRLKAIPHAELCIGCKRQAEEGNRLVPVTASFGPRTSADDD